MGKEKRKVVRRNSIIVVLANSLKLIPRVWVVPLSYARG